MTDHDRHLYREQSDADALARVNRAADEARRLHADIRRVLGSDTWKRYPEGLPVINPTTWAAWRLHCHRGRWTCKCGSCALCVFFRDIEMHPSDTYERSPVMFDDRPLFWSVESALTQAVTVRRDGYPSRSIAGAVVNVGEMGATIEGGERNSREQASAERMAEVARAVAVLYGPGNDRGIGAEACVDILFARIVGREQIVRGRDGRGHRRLVPVPSAELSLAYGVSADAVAGIVKSGMRRLRVELAARDLIEQPNPRRGLAHEIELRRQELARRRAG